MSVTIDARMVLLEYQVKSTHESLTNLSIDVREMKDALLQNIASNTASNTSVKDLQVQVDKLREFMWKISGFALALSLVGSELIKKVV